MRKVLYIAAALTIVALVPARVDAVWLEGQRPVFTGKIAAVFDTPGSYTWTVPDGVWRIMVEMWGGGGGGARTNHGERAGGGGGGYGFTYIDVTPGMTCHIFVGVGGDTRTWNGSDGGNTSITCGTTSYIATGGEGGSAGTSYGEGGLGGTSDAPFSIQGSPGSPFSTESRGGFSPRGGYGAKNRSTNGSMVSAGWPGGGGACVYRAGCKDGAPGGLVIYY